VRSAKRRSPNALHVHSERHQQLSDPGRKEVNQPGPRRRPLLSSLEAVNAQRRQQPIRALHRAAQRRKSAEPIDDELTAKVEVAFSQAISGAANYSRIGEPEEFDAGNGWRGWHNASPA
jgi:hypothetical protein